MQREVGRETAFTLRCPDCGEYFYAAHRGLIAFRCCCPTDLDAAFMLVLPQTEDETFEHQRKLMGVEARARELERRLFSGEAQ